jgi:hypothetical protein
MEFIIYNLRLWVERGARLCLPEEFSSNRQSAIGNRQSK